MSFAFRRLMTAFFVTATISVLLSGNSGCLVPPPIPETPVIQNSAPRIDINKLDPHPVQGPVVMSTACTSYTFRVQLTDRDYEDTLYWRVFADYHRDWFQESLVQFADPSTQVNFSIYPNDPRFFQATGATGLHTVEILVSDRPFDDESFPPGRDVLPESDGFIASFVWPVEIVADTLPCEEPTP
jgi:hypothetical protein